MVGKVEVLEPVIGCFKGLSTGDAIGKQTESLRFEEITVVSRRGYRISWNDR